MADQSHLDNLAQGVQAWNSWRKLHPSMRPNLSEVNLRRANLTGANLVEADLSRVNFETANLLRLTSLAQTLPTVFW